MAAARTEPASDVDLPGPRWPVLVQTLAFARYRHRVLPRLQRRYGDLFALRIAPHRRRIVLLARPEDIRVVFGAPPATVHAGEGNAVLEPMMGPHSVLLLDEDDHHRVRQLLMPAFNGAALRGYRQLITELTAAELDRWPAGGVVNTQQQLRGLTLEIILRVVFGVSDEHRLARLRPLVARVVDIRPYELLGSFYPRLHSLPPWRGLFAQRQALDRLLYAEIAERRAAGGSAGEDVLSRLLAATDSDGAGLDDTALRDNLVTLLLAGHETTATALAWACHELARSPAVAHRARQAADEHDEAYLEAVAKESLRRHPVIYQVARRLAAPLTVGGRVLPAGVTVMPAIGLVQADARNFDRPEHFDPERFTGPQPAPNTWIPFGGGARRCLGAGFALLEASVVLGELLRRFELAPVEDRPEATVTRNVTLPPARGGLVRVSAR